MSIFFFALSLTCFSCVLNLGMRAGAAVRLSPCRRITLCYTLALKLQTSMCLSPGSQIMREGQSSKICSLRWQTVSCNRTIQVYKIARQCFLFKVRFRDYRKQGLFFVCPLTCQRSIAIHLYLLIVVIPNELILSFENS